MMTNSSRTRGIAAMRRIVPMAMITSVATLAFAAQAIAPRDDNARDRHSNYHQVNLVSDLPEVALRQDPNLVNAWGVSFGPASPFWISDNGTGKSTLYAVTNDAAGMPQVVKQSLEVTIPGGGVTGQLFNSTTNFHGDAFIFASEAGTISGWRGALGTTAELLATRPTANYKGLALAATDDGPLLLAANFAEGTVDIYDGDLSLLAQLAEPHAPRGYAPFNVQNLDGVIFVTFAKQDDDKEDDVAGAGHGLIDILNLDTMKFHRFATGTDAGGHLRELNSPWGLAIAPGFFGEHSDSLLVGNFGSGQIMSFDARGNFQGFLEERPGRPVVIEGLWSLAFGNGIRAGVPNTLYFTAGPDDERHGLFGSLAPVPRPQRHDDDHPAGN